LETKLKGGKVATVNVANLPYVDMQSKIWGKDARQLWRIKENGCLENKAKPGFCLQVEHSSQGSPVYMEPMANGQKKQRWTAETIGSVCYLRSDATVSFLQHLFLDVAWADVPLVSEHVALNAKVRDFTTSQTWRFYKA